MAGRFLLLLLSVPLLGAPPLHAQEGLPPIEPEVERREVDVDRIDTEDFELGLLAGVVSIEEFGSQPVYGLRFAYHVSEALFVELEGGVAQAGLTSYERWSGDVRLWSDSEREYTYYGLSLGYDLFPGEVFPFGRRALTTDLYLQAGAGATRFLGEDRFTVMVGAGMRILLSDWFALHLDARDQLFRLDLFGESKTAHNLQFTGGFTVFF